MTFVGPSQPSGRNSFHASSQTAGLFAWIQAFRFGSPAAAIASTQARTRPAVISYLSRYTVLPGCIESLKPATGSDLQQLSCPGGPSSTSPSPQVSPPRCGLQLFTPTHFFA